MDMDLLELAAKAAGLSVRWHSSGHYGPTMEIMEDEAGGPPWNPITDDGDALRLAVHLGLSIHHHYNSVGVSQYGNGAGYLGGWSSLVIEKSDEEITRRAIVRAAAEIGRAMKSAV